MRKGVGHLLAGIFLALWVGNFLVAIVGAWASENPMYTWTFFAVFGGLTLALAVAAAFFLVQGCVLLYRQSPAS